MKAAEKLLKFLNGLVSFVVGMMLLLAGIYAIYALWDNRQVYERAGDVQESLLRFKPTETTAEEKRGPGFTELQAINPDVCAWLSLDDTGIDYPVLQGRTNLSYLSTDVYGAYSLAGSIFLDSRNHRDGSDPYSLIYGHHMENHRMFGDLELYRDREFFRNSSGGQLIFPEAGFRLDPLACFQAPASEALIFDPEFTALNLPTLLNYAEQHAQQLNADSLRRIREQEDRRILALTTCSTDFTDSRTVVLMEMTAY